MERRKSNNDSCMTMSLRMRLPGKRRKGDPLLQGGHRRLERQRLQGRPLRLVLGFLLTLPMGLGPGPAHAAQQYNQSLNFQTSNQSMWAAGPQYVASWSQEYS